MTINRSSYWHIGQYYLNTREPLLSPEDREEMLKLEANPTMSAQPKQNWFNRLFTPKTTISSIEDQFEKAIIALEIAITTFGKALLIMDDTKQLFDAATIYDNDINVFTSVLNGFLHHAQSASKIPQLIDALDKHTSLWRQELIAAQEQRGNVFAPQIIDVINKIDFKIDQLLNNLKNEGSRSYHNNSMR